MKTISADIRNGEGSPSREPFATTGGRPGQLLRGLEFDGRLLLFQAGDGDMREYDGYLEAGARNFFHPGLRTARLLLTEAAMQPRCSRGAPFRCCPGLRSLDAEHRAPSSPARSAPASVRGTGGVAVAAAHGRVRPLPVYDLSPRGRTTCACAAVSRAKDAAVPKRTWISPCRSACTAAPPCRGPDFARLSATGRWPTGRRSPESRTRTPAGPPACGPRSVSRQGSCSTGATAAPPGSGPPAGAVAKR